MPTWPSTLPQDVHVVALSESFANGSVRQDMDSGPAYQRQRYTASPDQIQGQMLIDRTQYATFKSFWKDTLAHGSLSFDWKHPITEASATVQFDVTSPPSVSAASGDYLILSLMIEVLP